jgi:multiple sugar transport system substrate-binding protein
MIKKNRIVFLVSLMILALILPVMAQSDNAVELNTLEGPSHVQFLAQRFQELADAKNIKVNLNVLPYGRDAVLKLVASFMAGGSQYDVFVLDCVDVARYASAGWLYPIDDLVPDSYRKDIIPFAKEGMMYQGKWYGLPWSSEWKSFIYNTSMLQKEGLKEFPKTWRDVVAYSQKLQKGKVVKYATAFSWAQKECLICDFVALAATFGGNFFDDNLNPLFNKGGAVDALQWMIDSIYTYKIVDPASLMWTEDDVQAAMKQGDIAYSLSWGNPLVRMNNPDESKVVGQVEIGMMPSVDGKHPYTVAGPMGYAISKNTKHPKEAWEFIKFMAGPEGSRIGLEREGYPAGWKSVIEDPQIQNKFPELKKMALQSQYIVNRPAVPWYGEFSVMLAEELHKALTGKMTAQQALDEAVAKTLEIKKAY